MSEKDEATYRRILAFHDIDPPSFLMVGNSLRSDVLPVVAVGGRAVHVPYEITWAHEHVDDADVPPSVAVLDDVGQLPAHVRTLR